MANDLVKMYDRPDMKNTRLVLGFSGWMDGGDVSTGTIQYLVGKLEARKLAEIDPGEFHIYNFPGSMEVSALFRPHTKIRDGLIDEFEEPANTFYYDEENRLILFEGNEPNLRWKEYADCIFSVAVEFDVTMICFVGSVAGLVPHTREPRFSASISDEALKATLEEHGLTPSNYEGPASIVTYLLTRSRQKGLEMINIVAEIPAYIQGKNLKCIEAVTRKLAAILRVPVNIDDLNVMSRAFEKRLDKMVEGRPDLADQIRKIEEDYDKEVVDTEMTDLRTWFERQGIRLD